MISDASRLSLDNINNYLILLISFIITTTDAKGAAKGALFADGEP